MSMYKTQQSLAGAKYSCFISYVCVWVLVLGRIMCVWGNHVRSEATLGWFFSDAVYLAL